MDGIEERTKDVATVVRVNIRSAGGRVLAERYGVSFTPTFLLFDRNGALVERTSAIAPEMADRLRALAEGR